MVSPAPQPCSPQLFSHKSGGYLLKAVLMMEPAEDRPRDDPHLPWEVMADDQGGRQSGRWLGEPRAETRVRAAAIVMEPPDVKNLPQLVFGQGNQVIQALAAEAAE